VRPRACTRNSSRGVGNTFTVWSSMGFLPLRRKRRCKAGTHAGLGALGLGLVPCITTARGAAGPDPRPSPQGGTLRMFQGSYAAPISRGIWGMARRLTGGRPAFCPEKRGLRIGHGTGGRIFRRNGTGPSRDQGALRRGFPLSPAYTIYDAAGENWEFCSRFRHESPTFPSRALATEMGPPGCPKVMPKPAWPLQACARGVKFPRTASELPIGPERGGFWKFVEESLPQR